MSCQVTTLRTGFGFNVVRTGLFVNARITLGTRKSFFVLWTLLAVGAFTATKLTSRLFLVLRANLLMTSRSTATFLAIQSPKKPFVFRTRFLVVRRSAFRERSWPCVLWACASVRVKGDCEVVPLIQRSCLEGDSAY